MEGKMKVNIITKIRMCQELTNELNDALLNLLDHIKDEEINEDLEELKDFCNELPKWSSFNDAKSILENLCLDEGCNYNE